MGSCISKCIPNKQQEQQHEDPQQNHDHEIEDKLVISQAPPLSLSNKISTFPPPSPSSTSISSSSLSSSFTNESTHISTSSSLSTTSSAQSSSKDQYYPQRLFSNEFLYSCYKENPHVIRINSLKQTVSSNNNSSIASKAPKLDLRSSPLPQRVCKSTPQKRLRSSSPTPSLTRQKSFRKDPESLVNALPNRTLRSSPSPSRRFSKENCHSSKRVFGYKGSEEGPVLTCSKKEFNVRPASPNLGSRPRPRACSLTMTSETCVHRVGSKIDERAVGDVVKISDHDMIDSIPTEDIDNPLISLDCFIFL